MVFEDSAKEPMLTIHQTTIRVMSADNQDSKDALVADTQAAMAADTQDKNAADTHDANAANTCDAMAADTQDAGWVELDPTAVRLTEVAMVANTQNAMVADTKEPMVAANRSDMVHTPSPTSDETREFGPPQPPPPPTMIQQEQHQHQHNPARDISASTTTCGHGSYLCHIVEYQNEGKLGEFNQLFGTSKQVASHTVEVDDRTFLAGLTLQVNFSVS